MYQATGLVIMPSIIVEIGTDPVLQVDGFANIDHLAIGILHDVTAGFGRQGSQNPIQMVGYFHERNFITGFLRVTSQSIPSSII